MAPPVKLPADPAGECGVCHSPASGKFCSNCGAPLAGANCGECGAVLTVGAKFCHRCGTPARAGPAATKEADSFANALPWAVAGIAMVALIALIVGQRFRSAPAATTVPPDDRGVSAAPAGSPPDISNLTPAEAPARLYHRDARP